MVISGKELCSPPQLENGWVRGEGEGDIWVGEFTCRPGYILLGTNKIKCRAGTWSSDVPKCTGEETDRL
jgi:hypothetical protein